MKPHRLAIAIAVLALAACATSESPATTDAPAAKRPAGRENAPLLAWRAFGTEPFWNVNVEDATLTYTTPEDQDGVAMQGTRRSIPGGVEIAGDHEGKPFVLTVTAGDCNDGMSDNRYQLVSTFRYGDIDYNGCGEAAK